MNRRDRFVHSNGLAAGKPERQILNRCIELVVQIYNVLQSEVQDCVMANLSMSAGLESVQCALGLSELS